MQWVLFWPCLCFAMHIGVPECSLFRSNSLTLSLSDTKICTHKFTHTINVFSNLREQKCFWAKENGQILRWVVVAHKVHGVAVVLPGLDVLKPITHLKTTTHLFRVSPHELKKNQSVFALTNRILRGKAKQKEQKQKNCKFNVVKTHSTW